MFSKRFENSRLMSRHSYHYDDTVDLEVIELVSYKGAGWFGFCCFFFFCLG